MSAFSKKARHRLSQRRVEGRRVEGHLVVDDGGVALPVAPDRQAAGRHLVEGDSSGEALGIGIPARWLAQREEWIQVRDSAGTDVLRRGIGEREVEEHQVQLLGLAHERNAEVLRLDVAVRHALLLQPIHDLQKIFPKALQQLQMQAALFPQALGQGLVSRPVHDDADPAPGSRVRRGAGR